MKHYKLENINVLPILKEVVMQWEDFYINTGKQIDCQRETMEIQLREGIIDQSKKIDKVWSSDKEFKKSIHATKTAGLLYNSDLVADTETYKRYPYTWQFVKAFEKNYGGKLYRMSIVHLPPNGKVHPHIDYGDYYKNKDRFHLVLSGYYNCNVKDDEETSTKMYSAGELWWFDNNKTHWTENISTGMPRIAIIFDVLSANWRKKYLNK